MPWNVLQLFVTQSWIHNAVAVSPKAIILQVQQAPETECFKLCYLKLLDPLMMWLQNPACYGLYWGHSPTPVVHTPQKEPQGGFVFSCQGALSEAVCLVPCTVAVKTMSCCQLWLSNWITQAPQCINCVYGCPPVLAVCYFWPGVSVTASPVCSSVQLLQLVKQSFFSALFEKPQMESWNFSVDK